MKKLLASDIDGTLYINDSIHEKSIEYIKTFRKNGHAFLLCTGRNFGGIKHLFQEYDIEVDGYILCNGAVVLDKDLNVIYNRLIDDEVIKQVFECSKDNEQYNFYFADSENLYIIDGYNNHPMLSAANIDEKMSIIRIKEEDFYKNKYSANIIGIDIKDQSIEKTKIKIDEIENKFSDVVSVYRNKYFIDIVPKDASKADGISKVLNTYGVKEEDVFVIGDSWNDLSMFEKYKNSYTFNYVEEELKPHVNNLVDEFHNCLEIILK